MSHNPTAIGSLVLALSVLACGGRDTAGRTEPGGHVRLEADGRGPLLDAEAGAVFCERDSTIAVVVTDGAWTGAVAARVAGWPLESAVTFQVGSPLQGGGSAAAAVRQVADSIRTAYVGQSGRLELQPGSVLSGRLEAAATNPAGDTLVLRGVLERLPVTLDACSSP